MAFITTAPNLLRYSSPTSQQVCHRRRATNTSLRPRPPVNAMSNDDDTPEGMSREDIARIEGMRSRLEGLFGQESLNSKQTTDEDFDGMALRRAIVERWGVQYDIQPQRRHGRVYVQIMWRYYGQQSFYMNEEEYASHCEAIAILLKRWDVVDYFLDYISNIKKRPVVGITVNIPIPGLDAATTPFEV